MAQVLLLAEVVGCLSTTTPWGPKGDSVTLAETRTVAAMPVKCSWNVTELPGSSCGMGLPFRSDAVPKRSSMATVWRAPSRTLPVLCTR